MTDTATRVIDRGFAEFVTLISAMTAIVALSIDAMLPALPAMTEALSVADPNETQLVIVVFFLGLAIGQLFYGPVSDSYGRKGVIAAGFGIYLAGTAICLLANDLETVLIGRAVQGAGAAGPRVIAIAVVRDRYEGRSMARVMAISMTIFVIVPIFAPMLGLWVQQAAGWQSIFIALAALAVALLIWMALRLDESLPAARRRPFRISGILQGFGIVLRNRCAVGNMLALGCVFGSFTAFLSSAPQILGETMGYGENFVYVFAGLAALVGVSSMTNALLVERLGMRFLSRIALIAMAAAGGAYALAGFAVGDMPVWAGLLWLSVTVGAIGYLFGNVNAMAMEPLGEIAGTGAAVVSASASGLAVLLGTPVAQSYDGTAIPVALGFAVLSVVALGLVTWAGRAQ